MGKRKKKDLDEFLSLARMGVKANIALGVYNTVVGATK